MFEKCLANILQTSPGGTLPPRGTPINPSTQLGQNSGSMMQEERLMFMGGCGTEHPWWATQLRGERGESAFVVCGLAGGREE
jgi:hypothetical protein